MGSFTSISSRNKTNSFSQSFDIDLGEVSFYLFLYHVTSLNHIFQNTELI